MDDREDLINCYSDLYKDFYGYRPRGTWMQACPLEELQRALDLVVAATTAANQREEDYPLENLLDLAGDERSLDEEYRLANFMERVDALRAERARRNNEPLQGKGWSYTPAKD